MQGRSHKTPEIAPVRRVRSYVLRAGRITSAQQRALAELLPRYGVEFCRSVLDLDRLFGRAAPVSLEIGFGNGEHLLRRATAEPERSFLGIEVHRPGIGHLLLEANRCGISNLRVIEHDAVEVLKHQVAVACLDEALLLFPDPWPKKRHHKRRLVQPGFIDLVASRLRPGGRLHIATDWQPYAEQMLHDLSACRALQDGSTRALDPVPPGASDTHEPTRFERRGTRLGHQIHRLLFVRTSGD